MKKSVFLLLFLLVSIADLVSVSENLLWLEYMVKPLIVPALVGYYLTRTSSLSLIFVFALLFCCVGDALLLFESKWEMILIFGIGAFLVAQILFMLSFRRHSFQLGEVEGVGIQRIRIAFPVVLAGTGLMVVLYPGLGALKIPVMLYALALTMMVLFSVFRLGLTSSGSFSFVLFGALLFMISDSILAIDKFVGKIPHASFWIMLTYCSALFLIVKGITLHPPDQ